MSQTPESGGPGEAEHATIACYRCPRDLVSGLLDAARPGVHVRRADDVGALMQLLREEVVDLIVADYPTLHVDAVRLVGLVGDVAPDVALVVLGARAQAGLSADLLAAGPAWALRGGASTPGLVDRLLSIAAREAERHVGRRTSRDWLSWTRATRRNVEDLLHELRTPVSIIQGYVANLLDEIEGPLTTGQREALERVRAAAELLISLSSDLRDRLPRRREPTAEQPEARRRGRRQIDVMKLCGEVLGLFEPAVAEQGLSLTVLPTEGAPGELPRIWADRARLSQLLVNLVSNAVRITPSGGRVSILVSPATIRGRVGVRLRVRDTGPGVAREARDRVFERGWSTDPSRAGLGLSICREIAREHRGDLRLLHGEEVGACFELRLPADARRRPVAVRLVEDAELAQEVLLKLCAEQAPPRRLEPAERDVDELVGRVLDGAAALVVACPDSQALQSALAELTRGL